MYGETETTYEELQYIKEQKHLSFIVCLDGDHCVLYVVAFTSSLTFGSRFW